MDDCNLITNSSVDQIPPHAPGSDQAPARPVVSIVTDDLDDFDGISHLLEGIGYTPRDGRLQGFGETVLATLVNADCDPDFNRARRKAESSHVMMYNLPHAFDRRLAAARSGVELAVSSAINPVELSAWLIDCERKADDKTHFSVMIVDDDEIAAEVYAEAMREFGMVCRVISDVDDVIEAIDAAPPDIIVMDMQMPKATGIEVASVIRQSRSTLATPIVFLSAERDLDVQFSARSIGGDDFISKPINAYKLVERIRMRATRALALRQMMESDGLTGLLNHARFKDRVEKEVERSRRTGSPLALCLIDIDHFKSVNDTYGHQLGDHVIQVLASTLRNSLRRTDVIARYGGEEFGVLLLDTDLDQANLVIERIRERFSTSPIPYEKGELSVSFSAGVSSWAMPRDAASLFKTADVALYQAKRNGRDRVVTAPTA
ncbi:diguanylate cyclase (GGDEF) domain-containing protein [Fulvimarina manganoxydans]|uniref:diguanylate cyclase n=1 Tax=Fulvimarina manganoxydans TaxID=937218 RepID=A0A1W2ER10_9HYPH|nr:diguanylate cyclase [Fulvimarina manganoxydans]SMD12150.1 diguanylate cyclase (GGDEF) domain-containing protein [Fulvimarina manganoxydans]